MALTDNLQAFFELADVTDAHGSNTLTNNGTTPFVAGKVGNAADFNGSSQWLSIVDNAALSMGDIDFFIQAWAKFDTLTDTRMVVSKGNVGTAALEYAIYGASNNTLNFRIDNGTAVFPTVTFAGISTATWYHVIGYHDATANTIGIVVNDGTPVTTAWSGGSQDAGEPFRIGEDGSSARWMDGPVDQVGIWKRMPSAADITQLFNSNNGLSYAAMSGAAGTPARIKFRQA